MTMDLYEYSTKPSSGGGLVSSVFGRIGAVVAVLGDYTSSLVTNASSVVGATVTDALNTILAALSAFTLNNQTGTTYTFVLSDAGKLVTGNNAASQTFTIPANGSAAYPVGTVLSILQMGAGQITVALTTDTLRLPSGFTAKLRGQYSQVTATKIAATEWVLSGDLAFV